MFVILEPVEGNLKIFRAFRQAQYDIIYNAVSALRRESWEYCNHSHAFWYAGHPMPKKQ